MHRLHGLVLHHQAGPQRFSSIPRCGPSPALRPAWTYAQLSAAFARENAEGRGGSGAPAFPSQHCSAQKAWETWWALTLRDYAAGCSEVECDSTGGWLLWCAAPVRRAADRVAAERVERPSHPRGACPPSVCPALARSSAHRLARHRIRRTMPVGEEGEGSSENARKSRGGRTHLERSRRRLSFRSEGAPLLAGAPLCQPRLRCMTRELPLADPVCWGALLAGLGTI